MKKLIDSGMVVTLHKKVIDEKVPVLGICIGLHLKLSNLVRKET